MKLESIILQWAVGKTAHHTSYLSFFSCPQQLNRWPCHWLTDSVTDWLTVLLLLKLQSDPRDLWPLRHLFRVMRRHHMTKKNWQTKTKTKTKTFWEHLLRAIREMSSLCPQEISWSSGMHNPKHPSSRQCVYTVEISPKIGLNCIRDDPVAPCWLAPRYNQ